MRKIWGILLVVCALLLCGIQGWAQTASLIGYSTNGIVLGGGWIDYTQGGVLSRAAYAGSQIDLMVTGTAATLNRYQVANSDLKITVRDAMGNVEVAQFTPTVPPNTWQGGLTLFSGLTDTPHWVSIYCPTGIFLDHSASGNANAAFSVTGGSPSVAYAPNFGPAAFLTDAAVTPHLLLTGFNTDSAAGYSQQKSYLPDCEIWFYATGTSIAIRAYANGCGYRLFNVDTGQSYTVSDVSDNSYHWLTLATGLDGARHLWKVTGSGINGVLSHQLMSTGGLDLTATIGAKPVLAALGDSITAAYVGTSNRSWLGYAHLLADIKGYSVYNFGINGTTVSTTGGANAGETDARVNSVIAAAPAICFILYGTNDINAGISVPTFTTAFQNMVNKLVAGLPNCKFYVMGILPTTYGGKTQALIDTYNSPIQTIVGAAGANWTYIDTKSWNMGGAAYTGGSSAGFDPNSYFSDSLHPNQAGYAFMVTKLSPYIVQTIIRRTYHARGNRNEGRQTGRN